MKRLKTIPYAQVQEKLKISFDGLSHEDQEIFLDIAFFFIGMKRNDVINILDGCGYSAKLGNSAQFGIIVLIEQSLVTVGTKNNLRMHDLLRYMGREIIRE